MRVRRCFSLRCCLFVATALVALSGCRLQIKVPPGGTVRSTDGAYVCAAGKTCVIDVVDLFFDQTFVAMPMPGYYFDEWREKDRYLCGGESTPCSLSTAGFEGHPMLQALLESDETFFLEPRFIFNPVCPDPELVISPTAPLD